MISRLLSWWIFNLGHLNWGMLTILLWTFLSIAQLYIEAPNDVSHFYGAMFIDILFSQLTKPYWWDFVSIVFLSFIENAVSQHNPSFSNSFSFSERCSLSLRSRHCVIDGAISSSQNRNTGSVHSDHLWFSEIISV